MEGILVRDVDDLLKKAKQYWDDSKKKRADHEAALKKKLATAVVEENSLIKKLTAARKAVGELQKEYRDIEQAAEGQEKERIEKLGLSEADVLSGKITLKRFKAEGLSNEKRAEMLATQTLIELSSMLSLIRKRQAKILRMEFELAELQQKINGYQQYPGEVLSKSYADVKDFVDREMSALYAEGAIRNGHLQEIQKLIQLSEGKSLGSGHRWNRIRKGSPEFEDLIFNPAIPEGLISDLKKKTSAFATGELLNVVLYMGGGRDASIEISPTKGYGPNDSRDIAVPQDSK